VQILPLIINFWLIETVPKKIEKML